MVKSISFYKHQQQCKQIQEEILILLKQVAYDGRCFVKVRFREKTDCTNIYIIEVKSDLFSKSKEITLEATPFDFFWTYYKKQIMRKISLKYCKKSHKGGYTFY